MPYSYTELTPFGPDDPAPIPRHIRTIDDAVRYVSRIYRRMPVDDGDCIYRAPVRILHTRMGRIEDERTISVLVGRIAPGACPRRRGRDRSHVWRWTGTEALSGTVYQREERCARCGTTRMHHWDSDDADDYGAAEWVE